MVLDDAEIKDEGELESLLKKEPDQIERGLKVLGNQIKTPPTDHKIDLLCVDSGGILTIVELKVESDEHQMEQMIMYYDWALSNLDWIKNAYPKYKIKDETPRLILIAKSFPSKVITIAKYMNEARTKVDLYTYKVVLCNDNKEVICIDFPIPPVPEIAEKPKSAEEIVSYIKDDKVRKECIRIREYIKNIDLKNIEESPTKYSITYKYKGRNICGIEPRKDYFWIGWRSIDGSWQSKGNIKTYEEAKEIVDKEIIEFYQDLKKSR